MFNDYQSMLSIAYKINNTLHASLNNDTQHQFNVITWDLTSRMRSYDTYKDNIILVI